MRSDTRKLCLLFACLATLCSCGPSNPSTQSSENISPNVSKLDYDKDFVHEVYCNPLTVLSATGSSYKKEFPDPSVIKGNDGYLYAYSTMAKCYKSIDGVNWEVVTTSLINRPTWADATADGVTPQIWAPDVIYLNEKFYYVYSLGGFGLMSSGIGYAVSDYPDRDFVDKGKLCFGFEIGVDNCIDPQVFKDDDGSLYLTVGSFRGSWIMDIELTDDGSLAFKGGIEGAKANKVCIAGHAGSYDLATYEGSYIIKKDGFYYYFGSQGTCCAKKDSTYKVYVGKSDKVKGPYIDASKKPLTLSRETYTAGNLVIKAGLDDVDVAAPGHNSIFLDDYGDYWIYYHCYISDDRFTERQLFVDKLLWDDNGYPYVEERRPSYYEDKNGPAFFA